MVIYGLCFRGVSSYHILQHQLGSICIHTTLHLDKQIP